MALREYQDRLDRLELAEGQVAGRKKILRAEGQDGKAARCEVTPLVRKAESFGPAIAEYAQRVLDDPRPWSCMRAVYRLLGLVSRYGRGAVEQACQQALALDVIDVTRIERIVTRGLEAVAPPSPPRVPAVVIPLRFSRPPETYIAWRPAPPEPGEPHADP